MIINARTETVAKKRTFRDSLLTRQCIIPRAGFYNRIKNKYFEIEQY